MRRIIMMILLNLWYVPYGMIRLKWMAAHAEKYTEDQKFALLRQICHRALVGGRVTLDTKGLEHIPKENGFIIYPNHQGMFDMLAIMETCPKNAAVIAKKETGKVSFLRDVFKLMGSKLMDREDLRQSMQVILEVGKEVKEGKNYVIFAEGTRSKMGNRTQEFKGGSFKAAMKARCPIVPAVLKDSYKVLDTGSIKKQKVELTYLEPIPYEEYKELKTTEIAEMVRGRIDAVLEGEKAK